jgi:hypothetical protein
MPVTLADDDRSFGEDAVHLAAVSERPRVGRVVAELLVDGGCALPYRIVDLEHGLERLVVDLHELDRILRGGA